MRFTSRDGRVVVRQNEDHPQEYLFVEVDGRTFFLGVRVPGMGEPEIRAMANQFLAEHPEHYRPR